MTDENKKQATSPPHLERNTLTLSLLVTLLGIFCLPAIERRSATWYVLMLVFFGNAVIVAWVIVRLLLRKRRESRDG